MLLFESSRDNLLMPYLNLMREKGIECSLSQLKQFLLAKFVNEGNIRSLSLESNYYLAGVARYYFEGKLTVNKNVNAMYPKIKDVFNQDICQRLSALIVILRNSYIDSVGTQFEQPEDFGTLSLEKLLRKYNKAINAELGINTEKEETPQEDENDGLNRDEHVGNGYTFEILYSYNDARKYNSYTEPGAWCITYGEQHYNGYIRRLKIHYVIFRKDGFENIPRRKGPNWKTDKPQDEYGNSLIALLQSNVNGEPVYITSRWNHGSYTDNSQCEADHAYTKEEFMKITGVSNEDLQRIFKIWETDRAKNGEKISVSRKELNKKRANVLRIFKYAQMRINGGNFETAFGDYPFRVYSLLSRSEDTIRQYLNAKRNGNQASEKFIKKMQNESVKSCIVDIDDDTYFFLIDKNKILFETIVEKDSQYDSAQYHFTSSLFNRGYVRDIDAENFNNVILCKVVNGIMIYDFIRHAFVDIDGKKKFKYISQIYNSYISSIKEKGNGYYEVKMSDRQCAFVDWRTNIPLKLPNGSCWFESVDYPGKRIHYSRSVECGFIKDDEKVARFIYDSASGEEYFYDIIEKRFFTPVKDNENPICKIDSSDFPFGIYTMAYGPGRYNTKYLMPYKGGKPIEINGISRFFSLCYIGNNIVVYQGLDKNYVMYDMSTGEIIDPPFSWDEVSSGPITERYNSGEKDGNAVAFRSTANYHYEFLFSVKGKKFLLAPEHLRIEGLSPYLFSIYGHNLMDGYITALDKNGEKYKFRIGGLGGDEIAARPQIDENIIKSINFDVIKEAVIASLKEFVNDYD